MRKIIKQAENPKVELVEGKDFKLCANNLCKKKFFRSECSNIYIWNKKIYCCRICQGIMNSYISKGNGPKFKHKNSINSNGMIDAANEFQRKYRKRQKKNTKCYSCVKKRGFKKLSQEELWKLVPSIQPGYRSNVYGLQSR